MRLTSCRAYALSTKLRNADRLDSRALIGYLIGYQSTNIFRIWSPATDEILVTRDVVFEPTRFFDGYEGYVTNHVQQEIITTIVYPHAQPNEQYTNEELQLLLDFKNSRPLLGATASFLSLNVAAVGVL
jgi:hypothetical protein